MEKKENRLQSVLSVGSKAVLALLVDRETQSPVCGSGAFSVRRHRFTSKRDLQHFHVAALRRRGASTSLANINYNFFAGFSTAGFR